MLTTKEIEEMNKEGLLDDLIVLVSSQIHSDISNLDFTAIHKLLRFVPQQNLQNFLTETGGD